MSSFIPDALSESNAQARHYSYECKAPAQERPYTSRPSRTQQLANPKLAPKLTSDTPNDLLRKKGVADEVLAKKEEERGRKRKADSGEYMNGSRKRSRSTSSDSSDSFSTISTDLSRSSSPQIAGLRHTGQSQVFSNLEVDRKRGRSRSPYISSTSDSSHGRRRQDRPRKTGSDGYDREEPIERVARRPVDLQYRRRERTRSTSLSDYSHSSKEKGRKRSLHVETRRKRRRHSSRSPVDRGRDRDYNGNRGSRRTRTPSESRDRDEVIRNRKSMTPNVPARQSSRQDSRSQWEEHHPNVDRLQSYSDDNDRYGSSARVRNEATRPPPNSLPPRKERSLSPFSKRLKLTQAMNMGH